MEDLLNKLDIKYDSFSHKPVFTAQEAEFIKEKIKGIGCKNLFLKSNNGQYYLYILEDIKRADLKALEKFLNAKIHFASSTALNNILKLLPGGVTPLGIINDTNNQVIIIIDHNLVNKLLLMHTETNTKTISINYNDLIKYITYLQHQYLVF